LSNEYIWKWQIWKKKKLSEISKFHSFEYEIIWQTQIRTKWYQVSVKKITKLQIFSMSSLDYTKVIPDLFQEFLRNVIQENSKIQNFEYEVIRRTFIRTKWHQLQLSSLYLAKVMAIPDFFKEFLRIFIQEISKIPYFEYEVIRRTPIRTKW
jgi:hypothetical protein